MKQNERIAKKVKEQIKQNYKMTKEVFQKEFEFYKNYRNQTIIFSIASKENGDAQFITYEICEEELVKKTLHKNEEECCKYIDERI